MANKLANKRFGRQRRGVGAIIAGVILTAILVTTVLVYFVTILNNERARASYEINSQQAAQDKSTERLTAFRDHDLVGCPATCSITVHISNNGSLPLVVSKVLLYCTSSTGCPGANPHDPTEIPPTVTLNPSELDTRAVAPVATNLNYRVDVISERGNIVSTVECTVDFTAQICSNDSTGGPAIPDFSLSAAPSSLVFEAGETRTSTITVTSINGFNSAVALNVPTTVADITTSLLPTPVTPPAGGNDTSTFTVTASLSAAPGTYLYTIEGTSGVTHTTQLTVTILGSTQGEVDKGIIQGTGSLKLDFKAFGAIYPQLAERAGIDQRGWDTRVFSGFSWVPGYPAYDVMLGKSSPQIVFIESARNMDPSGQDLVLNRNTGLVTSNDQVQGTPPKSNYICKGDVATKSLQKYNEGSNSVTLTNTPIGSPDTAGWERMFFCSIKPSDGADEPVPSGDYWTPGTKFSQLNGLFWIARGTFTPIFSEYAQTVPYQAVTYAKDNMWSCIRNSNINTSCVAPNIVDNAASLRYSATQAQMKSGVTVWVRIHLATSGGCGGCTAPTSPYNISWLYPDGTYTQLATNQILNSNGNIQIDLPRKNTNDLDGNTVDDIDSYCAGVPAGQGVYFTLIVTDSFDGTANRNVYDMTWKMIC